MLIEVKTKTIIQVANPFLNIQPNYELMFDKYFLKKNLNPITNSTLLLNECFQTNKIDFLVSNSYKK